MKPGSGKRKEERNRLCKSGAATQPPATGTHAEPTVQAAATAGWAHRKARGTPLGRGTTGHPQGSLSPGASSKDTGGHPGAKTKAGPRNEWAVWVQPGELPEGRS